MGLFRLILVVLSLGWFGGLWFFSSLQCDSYEIRPGKHLGVCISVANNRLFVGSIPKNKTKENILEEFSKVTEGLVDVILYHHCLLYTSPSPRDLSTSRMPSSA